MPEQRIQVMTGTPTRRDPVPLVRRDGRLRSGADQLRRLVL